MTNPSTDLSARIADLRDEIEATDDPDRVFDLAMDLADFSEQEYERRLDNASDGEDYWIAMDSYREELAERTFETLRALRSGRLDVSHAIVRDADVAGEIRWIHPDDSDDWDVIAKVEDMNEAISLRDNYHCWAEVADDEDADDDMLLDGLLTWFSVNDLISGRAANAPTPEFRALASVLAAAGIRDTRVWRTAYEADIAPEYAVAMFAGAAA